MVNRAVGKFYPPDSCVIWNFDYLSEVEKVNPDLKQLLDNLRVSSLYYYLFNDKYKKLARNELKKVNWENQPIKLKLKFKFPIWILLIFEELKNKYSNMKIYFRSKRN